MEKQSLSVLSHGWLALTTSSTPLSVLAENGRWIAFCGNICKFDLHWVCTGTYSLQEIAMCLHSKVRHWQKPTAFICYRGWQLYKWKRYNTTLTRVTNSRASYPFYEVYSIIFWEDNEVYCLTSTRYLQQCILHSHGLKGAQYQILIKLKYSIDLLVRTWAYQVSPTLEAGRF